MIEGHDLWKSFGGVQAVRGVSAVARDGEITGVIGPNGAGKTTLFRLIYAVLRPDRGCVLVDGIDPQADRRAALRRLGVLPDNRSLYARLTAREHVRYFGRLHGIERHELDRRIAAFADTLDMADFIHRPARGFSRGQQMKVGLARALVHEPQNIIMDEPTNGLDVATARIVRDMLRRYRDAGRCILLSSHIMQEVWALADRIIVIANGAVALAGSPLELRAATGCTDIEEIFLASVHGRGGAAPALAAAAV
jgi:sodium transport system ATP-binding protein